MSKLTLLTVTMFVLVLASCSGPDKSTEYYPNGNVKFEVSLVDGKKHGPGKGYFEDGKVQIELNYENDMKEGLAIEYYPSGKVETKSFYHKDVLVDTSNFFAESGQLIQQSIANRHGLPVDIHRFKKDGSREPHMQPIIYLTTDTLRTSQLKAGTPTSLFVRIGNVDESEYQDGTLIISSEVKNHTPVDTLFMLESSNKKGFEYPFTPNGQGAKLLQGVLMLHNENADGAPKLFTLECKYDVVE
jgi:hypothetical protein